MCKVKTEEPKKIPKGIYAAWFRGEKHGLGKTNCKCTSPYGTVLLNNPSEYPGFCIPAIAPWYKAQVYDCLLFLTFVLIRLGWNWYY